MSASPSHVRRIRAALAATLWVLASCATWRPIDPDGDADLGEGVFVVMEDRALFVAVESIDGDVVRGTVRGGCVSGGVPFEYSAVRSDDAPEQTCERLGWGVPSGAGDAVRFPLQDVVQARVYDPRLGRTVLAGAGGVFVLGLLTYAIVLAASVRSVIID